MIPTLLCTATGCERAPMTSSGGWIYRRCDAHVRALLASFGPPFLDHRDSAPGSAPSRFGALSRLPRGAQPVRAG